MSQTDRDRDATLPHWPGGAPPPEDPTVVAAPDAALLAPEPDAVPDLSEDAAADERTVEAGAVPGDEGLYREIVDQEISFSRATGYDKEQTAVVPLAELARREEERLRRGQPPEDEDALESAQPRSLPVGELVDVLRAARSVEEVAGVLVELLANIVPRVLLFWQRRGVLYGFASRGMGLTEVGLMTIEVPLGLIRQMIADDLDLECYQGPPRLDGQVGRLFELLGGTPAEVLLIPIPVTAVDRWVLYADNGQEPLPALELRLLEVVASRAGARADWLLDRTIW